VIPRIIHYVWLGPNPLPALAQRCLESWQAHLPGYRIMIWGNDRAKEINNLYLQQAIHLKKWAFASDVIRLHALKLFGGIYLDTDVEVKQSLDEFLELNFFTGHEVYNQYCSPITTAVMGAAPGVPLIDELLSLYDQAVFYRPGYVDQTANTHRLSDYLKQKYALPAVLKPENCLTLENGHLVFPCHYFCTPCLDKPSYTVHHFSGSWVDDYNRKLKYAWGRHLHWIRFTPEKINHGGQLPLFPSEKLLFKFCLKNKIYALIKTTL
jgi:mannosyltransferase OCH1-like enzyme